VVAGLSDLSAGGTIEKVPGVVAAEDHGVPVLDAHLRERPGGDRVVDRVARRRVHAVEQLVVGRGGQTKVLAPVLLLTLRDGLAADPETACSGEDVGRSSPPSGDVRS
jgi:hypothetical protein